MKTTLIQGQDMSKKNMVLMKGTKVNSIDFPIETRFNLTNIGSIKLNKPRNRTYNVIEIFFRRNSKKRSMLCVSEQEAASRRSQLKRNRQKFLGQRNITLMEV